MIATSSKSSVTQADLARELGVTQVSVYRALRNLPGVSPELRDRVRRLAHERRYRIKTSARATSTGRHYAVSLLIGTVSETSHLPPDLLHGIYAGLTAKGYSLMISQATDEELSDEAFIPRMVAEERTDGILVDYTHRIPSRMIELIEHYRIPAVFINCRRPYDAVHPDDFDAGRRACRALMRCGHRRIAYIGPDPEKEGSHYSVRDRFEGYKAAMSEAGLKPTALLHRWTPGWEEEVASIWNSRPAPTALVTYAVPWQAIVSGAQAGLEVGRDYAVVTFEEPDRNPGVGGRALSSIEIPAREVGRTSVRMLMEKVERPDRSFPSIAVPFGPMTGDTCAPVR